MRESGQATDLQARILEGLYPYALMPRPGLQPSQASLHRMFRRGTRLLFDKAFQPRAQRPKAEEWRDHLDLLMAQMTKCTAKPDEHVHFGAGCGFCGHEARLAAARAKTPARAVKRPARTAVPISRPPVQPVARPVMIQHYRPPRPMPMRRPRAGTWLGVAATVALIGMGLATQELWRPLLQGGAGSARATEIADAALPVVPEAPDVKVKAFAEPMDYLVLPAGGSLSVPLRRGPGTDFAVIDRLAMHDAVIGRGTAHDANGAEWVWIARASDGLSGFVRPAALIERTEPALFEQQSTPKPESAQVAASKASLDKRYDQLLAGSTGLDRAYLSDGQKLWEAQRLRCADGPDPDLCRSTLDAQRRGDLEGWREAGLTTQRPQNRPGLTPASLDKLR